jgi:hypothetical protein
MATKRAAVAGSVGSLLFAGGALPSIIRLIDQISRLQTVVSLMPYLDLFSTPVSIGCLILGPSLVWYAISSEHKKDLAEAKQIEEESGPRIWTPGCGWRPDEQPPPLPLPPVNWLWFKVLAALGTVSVVVALGFAFFYHRQPLAKPTATVATIAKPTEAGETKNLISHHQAHSSSTKLR